MNTRTSPVTGDPVQLARAFQALADDKRVRVLELLGDGERCVCELAEAIDITQPLLSFHLRTLREAGLVSGSAERTMGLLLAESRGARAAGANRRSTRRGGVHRQNGTRIYEAAAAAVSRSEVHRGQRDIFFARHISDPL